MLKFYLSKGVKLFDKSEQNQECWQKVQSQMKEKYSPVEHEATTKIVQELGVKNNIRQLVEYKNLSDIEFSARLSNIDIKVAIYCDFRVSPKGYTSINKRFDDIIKRYSNRKGFMARANQIFYFSNFPRE